MSKYFSWSRKEWVNWIKEGRQREKALGSGLSSLEVRSFTRLWAGLSAVTTTCACGTMPR